MPAMMVLFLGCIDSVFKLNSKTRVRRIRRSIASMGKGQSQRVDLLRSQTMRGKRSKTVSTAKMVRCAPFFSYIGISIFGNNGMAFTRKQSFKQLTVEQNLILETFSTFHKTDSTICIEFYLNTHLVRLWY